jgi:hypothetical protein
MATLCPMRLVVAFAVLGMAACGGIALPVDSPDSGGVDGTAERCGGDGERCCDPQGHPADTRDQLLSAPGHHVECVDVPGMKVGCMISVDPPTCERL